MRRNAAFTLHLGHVTVDMKRRESNETRSQLEHACGVRMRARALHWTYNVRYICIYIQPGHCQTAKFKFANILVSKFSYKIFAWQYFGVHGIIDVQTEGSMRFTNPGARGCSVRAQRERYLKNRRFLKKVVRIQQTHSMASSPTPPNANISRD